jgi:hypothetical protein
VAYFPFPLCVLCLNNNFVKLLRSIFDTAASSYPTTAILYMQNHDTRPMQWMVVRLKRRDEAPLLIARSVFDQRAYVCADATSSEDVG